MNNRQNLMLAAIVATGLLLRPAGSTAPQPGESLRGGANLVGSSGSTEAGTKGPWQASCDYWAPVRTPEEQPKKPAELHDSLDAKDSRTDLHVDVDVTNQEQDLACGGELGQRWGFPKSGGALDVTAIIATVPDPVHGHLALVFDRTVDALLSAAADSHYVSSYYWLPWKHRVGALKAAESEGYAEIGHDPARERMPGLIILRHVPSGEGLDGFSLKNSFYKVIYVFLVAETPVLGVDGFQLQNAFKYEAEMKNALSKSAVFSTGRNGAVAIVGPEYSGSAASLAAGIETARSYAHNELDDKQFEVTGTTATELSAKLLMSTRQVRYLSFDSNGDYNDRILVARLREAGYDPARGAVLVEDNTTLGDSTERLATAAPLNAGAQMQVIRFPRNISLLRNAKAAESQYENEAGPSPSIRSPYLRFSLQDPSGEDGVPQFSREHTPISQEAQLMTIARQLHRNRSQFIAVVASDVLDQVFLAQFLHRACPDARLVFYQGDLLMVREIDNVPFIGSITITPYALFGLGRGTSSVGRTYSSSTIEAYYNAVIYTLWGKNPLKISRVIDNGPAGRAGLKRGDVITSVDGNTIADAGALADSISALQPGRSIEVRYCRDGEEKPTTLVAGDAFGALFEPAPSLPGHLSVSRVNPGGPADKAGLKPGDVITSVDGNPIADAAGLAARLSALKVERSVEVRYCRKKKEFTALVAWDPLGAVFDPAPRLQGHPSLLKPQPDVSQTSQPDVLQTSLWATAIGSDGYYPLAILSACASDNPYLLPAIHIDGRRPSDKIEDCVDPKQLPPLPKSPNLTVDPARLWFVLCLVVSLLCLLHIVVLSVADYWSPSARDLAIGDNDQPERRSMCVHVATAMLFSMAFIVSFPAIALWLDVNLDWTTKTASVITLGLAARGRSGCFGGGQKCVVYGRGKRKGLLQVLAMPC